MDIDSVLEGFKGEGPLVAQKDSIAHTIETSAIGWGEPQTLYASCACRWTAIPVEEVWEGYGPLIPELHPFVDKYGKEALYRGEAVGGNWDTLVRQCLGHLEVVSEVALATLLPDILQSLDEQIIDSLSTPLKPSARESVADQAEDRDSVISALALLERMPNLPRVTPVAQEVLDEYEEIMARRMG